MKIFNMKLGSIQYLIKEGFKGAWANRLMSLASIGVLVACMVVIGLAMLISENVSLAVGTLEKQNVIMVYMKDYNWALYSDSAEIPEGKREGTDKNGILESDYIIHNEEEAKALCDKIGSLDNVVSAEYISSEQGLEDVKGSMVEGQEEYFTFLDDEYGNPISAAAKVTMESTSPALFNKTIEEIKTFEGVDVIQSHGDLAEKIDTIKQGVYMAGFWIIAILIVISLVIVSNTIRVTMYNRKLEISIMKAVGATDAFIRIPFVIEGMLIGIVSAFISEVLIFFFYRVATEKIAVMLGQVVDFDWMMALKLIGVFIAIGVFAGVIGSMFIIGKYLKHEGSEFTAF